MGGSFARVTLPPALGSATYDNNNRILSWAGVAFGYDNNGNLTSDGNRSYAWDTRDRLSGMTGGGFTTSYSYDAFGRRTSRTVNGSQTSFLYDGWNPVHTGTGSTVSSTWLYGAGLDERYARITGGGANVTTLLPDALGSLLHMLDPGGALTATFTYEA